MEYLPLPTSTIQTIMAMVTIIGTAIMVTIHGPMVMAMDIQIGTIIMAITMVILAGIIIMAIMVGTMVIPWKMM